MEKVSVIFVKKITKLQSREIKVATLSFQVMKLTKRFSRLCRFLYNYRVFQNLWDFWKLSFSTEMTYESDFLQVEKWYV